MGQHQEQEPHDVEEAAEQGGDATQVLPLLGAPEDSGDGEGAWMFNVTDRPVRDRAFAWLFGVLLLAVVVRLVQYFAFDPASSPIRPLPIPSLLLSLLPGLVAGALLGYLGCVFVIWRAKRITPRGVWWYILVFAIFGLLSAASPLLQAIGSLSRPAVEGSWRVAIGSSEAATLGSSLGTVTSAGSHARVLAASWQGHLPGWLPLATRESTWGAMFQTAKPLGVGNVDESSSAAVHVTGSTSALGGSIGPTPAPPPALLVFLALTSLTNVVAAVLALSKFGSLLPDAAGLISSAALVLSSCGRAVPMLTVTVVSVLLYLVMVPIISLVILIDHVCKPPDLSTTLSLPAWHLAGPSAWGSGASTFLGSFPWSPTKELLNLLTGAMGSGDRSFPGSFSLGSPQKCSDLVNALVPTDLVGALFALLGLLLLLWLAVLVGLVLKFIAAFVVSESLANQRTNQRTATVVCPRDQWSVLLQGLRFALWESLGSLCLGSLLFSLLLLVLNSAMGALQAGHGDVILAPLLLTALDLSTVVADVLISSLAGSLLAASGKPFGPATKQASLLLWGKLHAAFLTWVAVSAAVLVLVLIAIVMVELGGVSCSEFSGKVAPSPTQSDVMQDVRSIAFCNLLF